MRFKYVGVKQDGERAFFSETGIVWMPGQEHEVENVGACAQMLKAPSVFEALETAPQEVLGWTPPIRSSFAGYSDDDVMYDEMEEQEARRKAAPIAAPKAEPAKQAAKPDALADLIDDTAVRAFAKDRGLKVHGIGVMKGQTLRDKVRTALEA